MGVPPTALRPPGPAPSGDTRRTPCPRADAPGHQADPAGSIFEHDIFDHTVPTTLKAIGRRPCGPTTPAPVRTQYGLTILQIAGLSTPQPTPIRQTFVKRDRKAPSSDTAAFHELMADVKPLRHDKVHHQRHRPPPYPRQSRRDEALVLKELLAPPTEPYEIQEGDTLSYCRAGTPRSVLRKLRRGHYTVDAELDLHGMTAIQAQGTLRAFLGEALDREAGCVRIIHGKGKRSSNQGPVLKPLVSRWLCRRDEVVAFCSARPVDGGTGAVYVLLKSR